jgi:uncharacterized protein YcbK (DUF882 family)
MATSSFGRRRLLSGGAVALLALALGPAPARAAAVGPRRLRMRSLHTGERLDATFHDGAALVPGALAEVDRFLRDPFTGDVYVIDPAVLDIAWGVAVAAERPLGEFEIVCGYRSPATNARLHAAAPGAVATNSLHLSGKAMDLRLPGLPTATLRDLALRLGRGGVGFYPGQDFVHLDSGKRRAW